MGVQARSASSSEEGASRQASQEGLDLANPVRCVPYQIRGAETSANRISFRGCVSAGRSVVALRRWLNSPSGGRRAGRR